MTEKHIIATRISVEWNDNPKLVTLDAEMPSDLQELFDQWLSDIEHEVNLGGRR
tara:strand:- start:33 stop:194 length:162 start_codon:yes stop_codon:yes gene_type:complete